MKKVLLIMLFSVALALPVFADESASAENSQQETKTSVSKIKQKGDNELGIKIGSGLGWISSDQDGKSSDTEQINGAILLGADFMHYTSSKLALGGGLTYDILKHTSDKGLGKDVKLGYTNIYFHLRYIFTNNEENGDQIYAFGHLGLGIMDYDAPGADVSGDTNGYWALGLGTTAGKFFIELLYSVNYGQLSWTVPVYGHDKKFTVDTTLQCFKIVGGYRFDL